MRNSEKLIFASLLVTILSLLSMILGLFRNSLFASFFGSTADTDSYYIAFQITNTLASSLSSCFTSIFYSYYAEKKNNGSSESRSFSSGFISLLLFVSLGVSVIVFVSAPFIIKIIAPTFTEAQTAYTITLLRLFQILPILTIINGALNSILSVNKQYVGVQLFGVFSNVAAISILCLLKQSSGIMAMIAAVTLASFVQFICLISKVLKTQPLYLDIKCFRRDIISPLKGMIPLAGGLVLAQLQTAIDNAFASSLAAGSISAINYSATIVSFVLVFSYSPIKTVIHPELVERIYSKKPINEILSKGFGMMSLILIPSITGIILLRKEIISMLYYRGGFSYEAVLLTSSVLGIYIVGVGFNCMLNYYSSVFSAKREFYVSVTTGGIAVIVNVIGNILLIDRYGVIGLAISTAIAHFVNAATQITWLSFKHKCVNWHSLFLTVMKPLTSSLIMCICGIGIHRLLEGMNIYILSALVIIPCVVLYIIFLKLLKSQEYILLESLIITKTKDIFTNIKKKGK